MDRSLLARHAGGPHMASEVNVPFRWNLVRRDQLGTLVSGTLPPRLPDVDEMVHCAAKVLARSGGGRMLFVGRSADSLFDLLSGVLAGTEYADQIARLPYSFVDDAATLPPDRVLRARAIFLGCDLTPERLTRGKAPTALVDLVHEGRTFTGLYRLLRAWALDERESWATARRKLRFVGITRRSHTSPNTWRWHQHADWVDELPANAVANVSLDHQLWDYWGNWQPKLTRSFHPGLWDIDKPIGPDHADHVRAALAEAIALVELGEQRATREAVARALQREPAIEHGWLRSLAGQIRQPVT